MAGLVSQFLWITTGSLENPDDLPVRVMGRLSRVWTVIKETRNSFFKMGRGFFGNLLQKREAFNKMSPPLADRILPKTHLDRYLHVIHAISSQQDNSGTLYLAGRQCPAFGIVT